MARLMTAERLVIASHNRGKLREIGDLLAPFAVEPVSAAALNLPEPEEDGDSFIANARIKALAAAHRAGLPALADDSGLEVAALGGEPGIYSARWAKKGFAMERVLERLADVADRAACFTCALVLAWPDGHSEAFEGRVFGTILPDLRGQGGFGYDPIFQPLGHQASFGEMTAVEKQAISHRAQAFSRLIEACFRQ